MSGVLLGWAIAAKFTLILFIPVWIVVWAAAVASGRQQVRSFTALLMMFVIALLSVNTVYGFDGCFRRLDSFSFYAFDLGGSTGPADQRLPGNIFADSWMGSIRMPLPEKMIVGLDKQKSDFDRPQLSFLNGKWRIGGWWYYYLYGFLVKNPIGVTALLMAGVFFLFRRLPLLSPDFLLLALIPATVLCVASWHTGFSHHIRYVIPALPFLFIIASEVAERPRVGRFCMPLVVLAVLSSLFAYPHSFSYFCEFVGGDSRGAQILSESNIAWGQDLTYLRRWQHRHPEAVGLRLTHKAYLDVGKLGLSARPVPVGPNGLEAQMFADSALGPQPGWFAINVSSLNESSNNYSYFRRFDPVAQVGGSFWIYHITTDDANRVRRELSLPPL